MTKLDDITNGWLVEVAFGVYDRDDLPKLAEKLKTEYKDLLLELIGEDPLYLEDGTITKMSFEEHDHREKLRAELRQKVNDL